MPYTLTGDDLRAHLVEQLGFLESSAEAFDAGFESEAKRMAHAIRILVHDTPKSHSILGQLGLKEAEFVDTNLPDTPGNVGTHGGLVAQIIGQSSVRWAALLDDVPFKGMKPFDQWWAAPVFRDDTNAVLTRQNLVLAMANKDGGSHVDPTLDDIYARLVKENSLGYVWAEGGIQTPATGPEKQAVRQITHEVLASLKPGYQKRRKPRPDDGIVSFGIALVQLDLPSDTTLLTRALANRKMRKRQRRREQWRQ